MSNEIDGFKQTYIKKVLRDVTKGLNHVHKENLSHLDIKPENILISNSGDYKLADFGLSRLTKCKGNEIIEEGDSRYLAKEMLNPAKDIDLTKVDIFALGITIY